MMRKLLAALLLLPALACAQILGGTTPSTGFGANPGISGQTTQPSFAAALTTTVVPSIALGSGTPTFTRATTASVTDQDNVVRQVLSGEVRFQGARRVQNLSGRTESLLVSSGQWLAIGSGTGSVPTYTENFAIAPDGTLTAHRLQAALNGGGNNAANGSYLGLQTAVTATNPRESVWARTNDGSTRVITLRVSSYVPTEDTVTINGTWRRVASAVNTISIGGASNGLVIGLRGDVTSAGSDSADILFWHPQIEETVGQSNKNPSEYVSVGVLSAPFQGANVDGVQYFSTLNGNTVASNVVTEAAGATIPSATLVGYLVEGARTNLSLSSTFTATWAPSRATLTAAAVVSPDGLTAGATLVEDATATNTHFIAQTVSLTAATVYTWSVWGKTGPGSKRWLALNSDLINVGFEQGIVDLSTCAVSQQAFGSSVTVKAYPAGWCYITASGASRTTGIINFQFMLANAASGAGAITYNGDNASGNAIWGAQVEAGAFASSYIPTLLATVPRNADVLSYPSSGNVSATVGTSYAEVSLNGMNGAIQIFLGGPNSGAAPLYLYNNGAVFGNIQNFDGTTTVAKTMTSMATVQKAIGSWGPTGKSITGAGAASPGTGAFDGDMNSGATIEVGSCGGNFQAFGTVRNVVIFPAQFTDAQLTGKVGP